MWQFFGLLCLSALLFALGVVASLRTTDAWNKWHKKDTISTKMEQSVKDSPGAKTYQAGRDIKTD